MLIILLSTQSVIGFLNCGNGLSLLLNLNLTYAQLISPLYKSRTLSVQLFYQIKI